MVSGLLGICLLVVEGCGGNDETTNPDDDPGGPLSRQSFARAYAKARCAAYVRCACDWSDVGICSDANVCPTSQNCVAVMAADQETWLASTDGLAVEFSPERGQACLDAIASAECSSLRLIPVCARLFLPLLPLGANCADVSECVGWETNQAVCEGGVCAAGGFEGPHGTAGSSCNSTVVWDPRAEFWTYYTDSSDPTTLPGCYLADGLACVAGVCSTPVSLGGSCVHRMECAAGTVCRLNTCSERFPLDASCPAEEDWCVEGTYCGCAEGTSCLAWNCRSQSADGVACAFNGECLSGWCHGQVCRPNGSLPVCEN